MAIGADLIFYLNVFLISHTRFWNIHQASAQSTRLTEATAAAIQMSQKMKQTTCRLTIRAMYADESLVLEWPR
jgi:hypothetical protein